MIRSRITRSLLALGAMSALGFAFAPASADAPVTVRVGATGNDTAAEVYYADDLGMFKKRGLEVQIQNLRNGAAEAAAVAGGALDVGEQNVVSMSHAHERGLAFRFIAPAGEYVASASTTSLVVSKKSTAKTGKDLEGKTIAVGALGDLMQIGALAWLEKHGADPAKVKFIEIPSAEIGAAISRGTVDAGVVAEPNLTMAEDGGQIKVLAQPYDAIGERFMINGWFAGDDWIKKNPATAKKFVEAIYEAGKWANTHHAESAKILDKHSRADASVVSRMRRASYGERFDAKAMQSMIEAAVHFKALTKSFSAGDLIDGTL
ncbi:MAG: NitT/TauT family transport system substrate-binding protein [Candidatus Eremiobacteraeota bacterium]|nr:NitT/TauT family transport system substrate-binding protein [Candidatus Eremiobacteraeota bacterium]